MTMNTIELIYYFVCSLLWLLVASLLGNTAVTDAVSHVSNKLVLILPTLEGWQAEDHFADRVIYRFGFWALFLNGEESVKKFSYPDPDLHQNLTNSSLSHTQPAHQISFESVYNSLRYPAHRQTDRQTDRGENINSVHLWWQRYWGFEPGRFITSQC